MFAEGVLEQVEVTRFTAFAPVNANDGARRHHADKAQRLLEKAEGGPPDHPLFFFCWPSPTLER